MADQSHASDARKARASRNQFDDPLSVPPPSYYASSLPHPNLEARISSSFTSSRSSSPYISPSPYNSCLPSPALRSEFPREHRYDVYAGQRKYNRRKLTCFLFATLILLIIALTIFLAVFKWWNSSVCVRWSDGTTSGDCSS